MAQLKLQNVKLSVRRDIASGWTAANPTLLDGEFGLETDTAKLKIGNGIANWVSLPYFAGGVGGATPQDLTYSVVTTASGTVALVSATHKSRLLRCDNAVSTTVTVEDDTTGGWDDAAEVMIMRGHSTGTVTVQADGTCSINGSPSFSTTISAQYDVLALKRTGANAWVCIGGSRSVTAGEINSETATDGHVLTADVDGVAVWQAVPKDPYELAFQISSTTNITTGLKHFKRIPVSGTITKWYLVADTSTTTTLDLLYHASNPASVVSICASAKPGVSAAQSGTDATLSGWTTAVTEGGFLQIEVEANDNADYLQLVLVIQPS